MSSRTKWNSRAEVSNRVIFLDQHVIDEAGRPAERSGNPRPERLRQFLSGHRGLWSPVAREEDGGLFGP